MRNADAAFIAALGAANEKGLVPRRFIYVKAQTRDSEPEPYSVGMWMGDDDITVNVIDGETGSAVSRVYYGMGTSLSIPKIPRVSDLTIQVLQVAMSQLSVVTQTLVRENNVRFAKVDIHEGLLSTETRLLVSAPEIAFLGEVDGDPIETPAINGSGSITLEIVSDAIRSLTRTNPAKRSNEGQKRRLNDQFSKYSNLVKNTEIAWGEK